MTLCNACGAHMDDWKQRTAFLCPPCYRRCPPKVMAVYEDAINAFERFKKEEYRRSLVGMLPRQVSGRSFSDASPEPGTRRGLPSRAARI